MIGDRIALWIERLLLVVGVVCLGWWSSVTVYGRYLRSQQVTGFERSMGALPAVPLVRLEEPAPPAAPRRDPNGLIGVLNVPRLGITTPVVSGDDDRALDVAAGHLPDTPLPWERGNSAVAAHRDGLFRPLQRIRRGDSVWMRTANGDFEYVVREMAIVQPSDLSVLRPGDADSLTLITCYPFAYIGHAPKRFVVRAERQSPTAWPPLRAAVASAAIEAGHHAPGARRAHLKSVRDRAQVSRSARNHRPPGATASRSQRSDRVAKNGDRRQRDAVARAPTKQKTSTASARGEEDDQPPKKKRRWYHQIFRVFK